MQISPLDKVQWKSVITNTLISATVVFLSVLQASGDWSSKGLYTAGVAAGVAAFKIVQKLFTPTA